ncbi:protein of unknown function [Streptomyces sp. KY70]|nr:protein of unknown function [Streptomyces sp. KY70]
MARKVRTGLGYRSLPNPVALHSHDAAPTFVYPHSHHLGLLIVPLLGTGEPSLPV